MGTNGNGGRTDKKKGIKMLEKSLADKMLPPLPSPVALAVASGKIVFYGEFRRGLAVEFSGKGGKVFHQSKSSVETESGTITVAEFLPDNVDYTKWAPSFTKGDMVFGVVRTCEESSGVQVVQAKLHGVKP
jgi:hypothetical protein